MIEYIDINMKKQIYADQRKLLSYSTECIQEIHNKVHDTYIFWAVLLQMVYSGTLLL